MTPMAHGGGAAHAAAIANAIKASGAIIRVEGDTFAGILRKSDKPLIVYTQGGFLSTNHQYLTSYKGLIFYTKTREQIDLPKAIEIIVAEKMWVPQ
jgi:hypothetical protein